MNHTKIILDTKLVGEIEGEFWIPSYQRGYRWGEDEVRRLLDDIYTNGTANYCLQPIVVTQNGNKLELVDGQQRLTTLYLIYKYMNQASGGFMDEPRFTLTYETREKSEEFLDSIDLLQKEDNIDFWFIGNAYETIADWFEKKEKKSTLTNMNKYFDENVKVIWYEVDESVDAISLFTRLNIGKIPLTSAELVKAMFLSNNPDNDGSRDQEEISLQWDTIERELHEDGIWYFLTNDTLSAYQTRIDLVLDLISGKPEEIKDKYYTFFRIYGMKDDFTSPKDFWRKIQHTFLVLKDWYENHELYHKIGYLIASDTLPLQTIYNMSQGKTKDEFKDELDESIRKSVKINANYAELTYEKRNDYRRISRLLLLFNVESVRLNGESTQWFPFYKFKHGDAGNVGWSLEHIHAQQSEGLQTQEMWKEWIRLHRESVEAITSDQELIAKMDQAVQSEKIERNEFESIQGQVIETLAKYGSMDNIHSIANLALLRTTDNAALNNSTFDVKRNEIIEMDKRGQYIPFCTKMVFLKYYTPSAKNQIHFWGKDDRDEYVKAINRVLREYLSEPIALEMEGK